MTSKQLQATYRANPFRPFSMHLADGKSYIVPHPEFLALDPTGRTVSLYDAEGITRIIDLMLVTEIELHGNNEKAA